MDEEHITLTSQEVRDLVHLLLDAVDIAEGQMGVPATWASQVWEQAAKLLDRLYGEEDPPG